MAEDGWTVVVRSKVRHIQQLLVWQHAALLFVVAMISWVLHWPTLLCGTDTAHG